MENLPPADDQATSDGAVGPLEEQLPPPIVATPGEVQAADEEGLTWWRPGWADILVQVGWRWIFLTPTIGLLAMAIAYLLYPGFRPLLLVFGFKLLVFVVAVALSLAGYVMRRIARARAEPFCIHCGYNLTGLPDHYRCPECGRPYTWRLIAEYRRDPRWFVERWHAQRQLPPPPAPFTAGKVRRRRRRDGTA